MLHIYIFIYLYIVYNKGDIIMFKFKMTNDTYDKLKWLTTKGLPAFGTFVSAVGLIWGIPNTEKVTATILALITMLGGMLGISTSNYNKDFNNDEFISQLEKEMAGKDEEELIEEEGDVEDSEEVANMDNPVDLDEIPQEEKNEMFEGSRHKSTLFY